MIYVIIPKTAKTCEKIKVYDIIEEIIMCRKRMIGY
jgi:hypothetical protein